MEHLSGEGHLVLTVRDLATSKAWHDRVLGWIGFAAVYTDDEQVYYRHSDSAFMLALFQSRETGGQTSRYQAGFHHIAFHVQEKSTIDSFAKFLSDHDVAIADPPKQYPEYGNSEYYAIFVHDPDGHRLELVYEQK